VHRLRIVVGLDEAGHVLLDIDITLAQPTQELTTQPTPTWSPTLNLVTAEPMALTTPATSWPGTMGYFELPHSLRAWWISEWHRPQYLTEMTTSSAFGSRALEGEGDEWF